MKYPDDFCTDHTSTVEYPDLSKHRTKTISKGNVAHELCIGWVPTLGWTAFHERTSHYHMRPAVPTPWFKTWEEAAAYARFLALTWKKST